MRIPSITPSMLSPNGLIANVKAATRKEHIGSSVVLRTGIAANPATFMADAAVNNGANRVNGTCAEHPVEKEGYPECRNWRSGGAS
ncbi:predicted protein [Nematostella vectensis]|uniref:Uncharacterized protein n=1 Tax=Nematostella vectensis TaxID=45351 RepID=A7RV53_NEMVE|nr:predicted protein [Nematostella vectensis]|eukprot:XP_001636752.1 predicted protein [Nematostella vectensis]